MNYEIELIIYKINIVYINKSKLLKNKYYINNRNSLLRNGISIYTYSHN